MGQNLFTVCVCVAVSKDEDVRESLGKFLDTAVEFYSHLLGMVESQLCFKTSDLVYDKVHFNSRTQRRKVGVCVGVGVCEGLN